MQVLPIKRAENHDEKEVWKPAKGEESFCRALQTTRQTAKYQKYFELAGRQSIPHRMGKFNGKGIGIGQKQTEKGKETAANRHVRTGNIRFFNPDQIVTGVGILCRRLSADLVAHNGSSKKKFDRQTIRTMRLRPAGRNRRRKKRWIRRRSKVRKINFYPSISDAFLFTALKDKTSRKKEEEKGKKSLKSKEKEEADAHKKVFSRHIFNLRDYNL